MSNPLITAIIPCRNEEKYIAQCLKSLLEQKDVNDKMEILVVDGMSTDSTRAIVEKILKQYSQVKLLDNLSLYTPHALNIGIKSAKGVFVAILGAHAKYAKDYLANSLELIIEHPEVSCVGGPITCLGKTSFGKATALAMSSRIGVGNAYHRFPNYYGYAEGACFPVFRKEVFSEVGLYDENLVRNQDDEFNLRLRKHGLKVYLSPKVKSQYYVRESPQKLFTQYFDYGIWRAVVIKKHKLPASFRQLVPSVFIFTILICFITGLFMQGPWLYLSFFTPFLYSLFLIVATIRISFIHGWELAKFFPIAVSILHISYGLGLIRGMFSLEKYKRVSMFNLKNIL